MDQLRTGDTLNVILTNGQTFDEIVRHVRRLRHLLGMATPEEEDDYMSYYTRL